MHYMIIGNGVAGINAANTLRNFDEEAEITIISYEHDHFFSRTALMYLLCGQLSERCVEPFERDHYDKMRFTRVRDKVVSINTEKKSVSLAGGKTLTYDKLLVATGSQAVMPDWNGVKLEGVCNFVNWQDYQTLKAKAKTSKKAVIIGGGLIGIETAEVLQMAGINTTFLIREEYYWPVALDKNESQIVTGHMKKHKVEVRLSTEINEILGTDSKVTGIKTTTGEIIDCDLAVICIGVRPQTDWLKNSGISLDERGGVIVDDYLQTNVRDIYAAGDCSSVVWFNGGQRPEQLWYTSRDQGNTAAINLVGLHKKYNRGTFYNSAKFFDIEYTTAGLINFHLEGEKQWFLREEGTDNSVRVSFLPDNTVIGFNMLGRRWNHEILVQWIEEKRKLEWVLKHLSEANFDEEFSPEFIIPEKVR